MTASRTCPACGLDHLVGAPEEVKTVFPNWKKFGAHELIEDADLVCSWCHSARVDGEWTRLESADQRAYRLSQAGNKSKAEYRETLGELPTSDSGESDGEVSDTGKAW